MPCVPPMLALPYTLAMAGACSTRTFAQSASSSSATMAARPAWFPWPNSMCLEMTVTVPSAAMRMNGPKAPKSFFAPTLSTSAGEQPTSRAPPVRVAPTIRASRRVSFAGRRGLFIGSRLRPWAPGRPARGVGPARW